MSKRQLEGRLSVARMLFELYRAARLVELIELLSRGMHFDPEYTHEPTLLKESTHFQVFIYPEGWVYLQGEWRSYPAERKDKGKFTFEVMWKENPPHYQLLTHLLDGVYVSIFQGCARLDTISFGGVRFTRYFTSGRTHIRL